MPAGALVQFWTVAPIGQGVPAAMAEPICKPDPDPNIWIQNENRAKRALVPSSMMRSAAGLQRRSSLRSDLNRQS